MKTGGSLFRTLFPALVVLCLDTVILVGKVQAQRSILTIDLLGKKYDVYAIPPVGGLYSSISALNNRQPFDDGLGGTVEVATVAGVIAGSGLTGYAGIYSPEAGASFLKSNITNGHFSIAEDISDTGVVIGWERYPAERSFIWTQTNRLQYLDDLYPQVRALAETLDQNQRPIGTRGYRINSTREMIIQGAPHSVNSGHNFYRVSPGGTVTPLVLAQTQGLDLNNLGQLPPPGPAGTDNLVLNDNGSYAGIVFDAPGSLEYSATRDGELLPDSRNARPTAINNSGYVAARPGIIWSPDGARTDIRQVLAAYHTSNAIPGFNPNGSSDTFINDANDISWGNLILRPACPEISLSASELTGFEFINGKVSVRVGNRFSARAIINNIGQVALRNVIVELAPASPLFRQVSDPQPPIPTTLEPGQFAKSVFEWEAINTGDYAGSFSIRGTSDCGPVETHLSPAMIKFVELPMSAIITAIPRVASLGEPIQVNLTVRNRTTESFQNVQPTGPLTVLGNGGVSFASGPLPVMIPNLAGGASATFSNLYTATNFGEVRFEGEVQGTKAGSAVTSGRVTSQAVQIKLKGDLLIKRATESAARYAINDEYQSNPAGAQVRTNTVAQAELSEFHVRMQNDEHVPRTFVLKIREDSDAGWSLKYLFNGNDISATLRATGMTFPELPTNATHTVTVQMTPTNAVPGDPMRVLLQLEEPSRPGEILDIVEAVTEIVTEIVVNSTGDEADASLTDNVPDVDLNKPGLQTTLRCAIDFANRKAGKDIIKFEIPAGDPNYRGGNPLIRPGTAFSNILDAVIIDGWSQDPSSSVPVIEIDGLLVHRPAMLESEIWGSFSGLLNWNGGASGLDIQARDCEIRGLSICRFPFCGVRLRAGGAIIQGNHIGFKMTGSQSIPAANGSAGVRQLEGSSSFFFYTYLKGAGIGIESDNNLIGGSGGGRQGNVISGMFGAISRVNFGSYNMPPGILITGAGAIGNQVEGNLVGLNPTGDNVFANPAGGKEKGIPVAGVVITDNARFNRIGSTAAGNVIANSTYGIVLDGAANENIVVNNLIGTDRGGEKIIRYQFSPVDSWLYLDRGGILVLDANNNVLGGESPSEGNQIGGWSMGINLVRDENTMVKNNLVGTTSDGFAIPNLTGIRAERSHLSEIRSNNISSNQLEGVDLIDNTELTIAGNQIRGNGDSGILGGGDMHTVIAQNTISANGARPQFGPYYGPAGITLVVSGQFHISRNRIYDNVGLGISFNHVQHKNDIGDFDSGPNGLQNYPTFSSPINPHVGAMLSGDQLHIKGGLDSKPGVYSMEFFSSPNANPTGFGEGRNFLGSVFIDVGFAGEGVIDTVLTTTAAVGEFLTATATDSDGNTSEFSRAVMIQDCVPGISGLCPGTEANVPNLPSGTIQPAGGGPSGDGNGDGIQDSLQDHVASFPTFSGLWMTLATLNGAVLEAVAPMGLADFPTLPANYIFPVGLLSFGITNLLVNGSIGVTNFLHLDAATNVDYTATTFFNYGPAPGNPTPHWYEFNYDGTTGAQLFSNRIVLYFQDGARGDHDLVVNGEIVTTGGPAALHIIPPGPPLSLLSASFEPGPAFGSNTMLTVIALAWPESATNSIVETTDNLSPTNFWEPVFDVPFLANGQLVLTNTSSDPKRFYRLKRLLYPDAFPGLSTEAAPLLSIQRTTTNTFLLSWTTSVTGFVLQQNTNLVTGTWTSVTNSVNVTNSQNQVIVPPAAGSRYFRLISQ